MLSKRNIGYLVTALVVPLSFLIFWQATNTGHYQVDACTYWREVSDAYRVAHRDGIFQALLSLYLKTMKPSLLGHLALPFVFLARGDEFLATAYLNFALFTVFLVYVFRLASLYLDLPRSVLATWLIAFLPYVFEATYELMSNLPMLMATAALAFHIRRSEFFKDPEQTILAGFWLGLGICIRPVDMDLISALPLTALIAGALKRETLSKRDCLAAGVSVGAAVIVLAFSGDPFRPTLGLNFVRVALAIAPSLGFFFFKKRLRLNSAFSTAGLLCLSIASLWLVPSARKLWWWTSLTAFENGGSLDLAYHQLIHHVPESLGVPFLILFCAGLLGWSLAGKRELSEYYVFSWMTLTLLFLGLFTRLEETRYYYPIFFILSLSSVILALRSEGAFPRARITLVALVLLLELSGIYTVTKYFRAPYFQAYFSLIQSPWVTNEAQISQESLMEALQKSLSAGHHSILILAPPSTENPFAAVTEPNTFGMLARHRHLDWTITDDTVDPGKFDALLVGPLQENQPFQDAWKDSVVGIAENQKNTVMSAIENRSYERNIVIDFGSKKVVYAILGR